MFGWFRKSRTHRHTWRLEMINPFMGERDCCTVCWARRYRRGWASVIEDHEGWTRSPPDWEEK